MSKQFCPICGDEVMESARHPVYVCEKDVARATDRTGKPIKVFNADWSAGFAAMYPDGTLADEVKETHVIYIDGIPYHGHEGHFGGVVVTPMPE